jgi:beta-lactamase superfamily II metal-dependent hydrolase
MVDYLHAIGANSDNVEFFIGTHPHDDHIGAAWRIIREFTPDRVYTPVYDDSFIDKYHQNRLWDNQYVYDQLVQAAHDTGAVLIQHIKEGSPVIPGEDGYASPTFALGDAQITIFNWVEDYQHAGSVPDANRFSFGVRVDVNGRRAWLAGDIDDMVDTEAGAQYGADSGFEEGNKWGETEHNEYLGDEMNIVNGIGDVDIMKLGHHGFGGSNVPAYLKSLSPSVCFVTGAPWNLREYTSTTLSELGSYMYVMSDARDRGMTAFCLGIGEDGAMTVNDPQPYPTLSFQSPGSLPKATVGTLPAKIYGTRSNNGVMYAFNDSSTPVVSSWKKIGGSWYYAGDNGVLATGWCDSIEEGTWYWFDDLGRMSVDSWVSSGGSKYYMGKDGRMQKNTVIDDGESTYYVGGDGKMVTDTEIEVDGKTMSFGSDGRLIEA